MGNLGMQFFLFVDWSFSWLSSRNVCVQAEGSHCLSRSSLLAELSCLLFQTRAKAAWQLGGLTALLFSGDLKARRSGTWQQLGEPFLSTAQRCVRGGCSQERRVTFSLSRQ